MYCTFQKVHYKRNKKPLLSNEFKEYEKNEIIGKTIDIQCFLQLSNKNLASSETDGIKIWDYQNNYQNIAILIGHKQLVYKIIEINDNLISGSVDKTVKVWSLKKYQCIMTITNHFNIIVSLTKFNFLQNIFLISSSVDGVIHWWDVNSWKLWGTFNNLHSKAVIKAIQLDDKTLATASLDKTIKIFNVIGTNKLSEIKLEMKKTLTGHKKAITDMILISNDKILSISDEQMVIVWNRIEYEINTIILLDQFTPFIVSVMPLPMNDNLIFLGKNNCLYEINILNFEIKYLIQISGMRINAILVDTNSNIILGGNKCFIYYKNKQLPTNFNKSI